MTKCSDECIPCCDFCIYVNYDTCIKDGKETKIGGPIGCSKHLDAEHQEIAEDCGWCEEFYCFLVGAN